MLNPIKSPHEMLLQSAGIPAMADGGSTGDVKGPFNAAVSKFKVIFNRAPNAEEMAQIEAHAHKHVQGLREGRQPAKERQPSREQLTSYLLKNPMMIKRYEDAYTPSMAYPKPTEQELLQIQAMNPTMNMLSSAESLPEENKRKIKPSSIISHYIHEALPKDIANNYFSGALNPTLGQRFVQALNPVNTLGYALDAPFQTAQGIKEGNPWDVLSGTLQTGMSLMPVVGAPGVASGIANLVNPFNPWNMGAAGLSSLVESLPETSSPKSAPQVSPEDMIPNIL